MLIDIYLHIDIYLYTGVASGPIDMHSHSRAVAVPNPHGTRECVLQLQLDDRDKDGGNKPPATVRCPVLQPIVSLYIRFNIVAASLARFYVSSD